MAKRNKFGFVLALIIVVGFPGAFALYFLLKPPPTLSTLKCLPIYGKKKPVERTLPDGKKIVDTIYQTLPNFTFTDHLGRMITQNNISGKVIVANFFFTTCPTICKDMTRNLKTVQENFMDDEEVMIISHTVDPETDSVAQLYEYAQNHDINSNKWLLLTGNKADIYNIARTGYLVTATVGDGGPNDFIHSEKLILVDEEGRLRGYYDGTDSLAVDQMMKDMRKLLVSYVVPTKQPGE